MEHFIRTDLALEAQELWRESTSETTELEGVESRQEQRGSFRVTTVNILDERGSSALGKPVGSYVTVELDALLRREENSFPEAAGLLSGEISRLLGLPLSASVLVAGLGNEAITPDAIGPRCVKSVIITRHLKEKMPEQFAAFRPVSAICAGVLGTTGMESSDMVSAIAARQRPDAVIAVDALASRNMARLCRTVQLSNAGITPGSGVGNSRRVLSRETLGMPVLAVGVPTVVDAATLASEMAGRAGVELDTSRLDTGGMIVTPRDIDNSVRDVSRLIGYALNMALHDGLTVTDVDMFLS